MVNNKYTKWFIATLTLFCVGLILLGGFTALIDPYFHYHAPLDFVKYELKNERYQNNGIVKHFDYDAIITGSSMTECFKPSELDKLFGVNSVKVPFSGGSYKEVNDNLKVAVEYNPDIKMVVRGLDYNRFFNGKDDVDYTDYPDYLYDDSVWNDAPYLFNKSILLTAVQNLHGYLATGSNFMSFDMYVNWSNYNTYGKEEVDKHYAREEIPIVEKKQPITEEEYARMDANIEQNITRLAAENPDIEFYLYFTPYSIYYFDYCNRNGELERQLQAEKYFIEKLLEYENIRLFSFYTEYDMICDLNNYKDIAHHRGEVNSRILEWMQAGEYELTADNYEEYCTREWDFYMNYEYDALFQ
ncbi:MAG: hypothetical protein E7286_05345 [Lachnospiraceae bacterium]|nr:hypothetical protein [Lachnospiraceae bacterium]